MVKKIREALGVRCEAIKDLIVKTFDLRDAFVFGGTGLIGAGVWQINRPAAFIITGAIFFWLGIRKVK